MTLCSLSLGLLRQNYKIIEWMFKFVMYSVSKYNTTINNFYYLTPTNHYLFRQTLQTAL